MKISNSWPDPKTTKPLTLATALTAKPKSIAGLAYVEPTSKDEIKDEDTDESYTYAIKSSSPEPPLSAPHMTVMLEMTGPSIISFPLSVCAILDNGCPSTVIDADLIAKLGLQRFPLAKHKDNLTSLTQSPLTCTEYVRLEATAKVNIGLPVPLILGIPFLSAESLVLDMEARTAIDKRTGYDIMNPSIHTTPISVSPTMPCKHVHTRAPRRNGHDKCTAPLHCEDHTSPSQIMALIRERVEHLSLEKLLAKKDTEAKQRYADCFPSELPKTTEDIPNHIYHRIRLKDPSKVVNSRGYSAPKRFHEPWKKLLEEHLAAGRLRPSVSEFASPSFCIPKHREGVPDLTVPPQWVNDYLLLNQNTV
ncbi:hypothetical protein C0995_010095 [Termitomyces sp. Mi166|nr:hypothetical protein C0995_010095 [Termitomyces sp. Mi166\